MTLDEFYIARPDICRDTVKFAEKKIARMEANGASDAATRHWRDVKARYEKLLERAA